MSTSDNAQRPADELSALDKVRERVTGMQKPEEFGRTPATFSLREEDTGGIEPMGFATRTEYELILTVGCRYWCNQAQKRDARQNAERILADLLYRDVLTELSQITHAVYDGDPSAALRRLGALQTRLRK